MSLFATPRGRARRLVTLPCAGGGTADFRRWALPEDIELLPAALPGREARLSERPYRSMAPLVEDLADTLPVDRPYTLYGHSMGAWLAFELCRELRRREARLPEVLLVGARHAPQVPTRTPPLGRLPQAAFLEGMQARYEAIPAVLLERPELLRAFLPALRADVVLLDDYRYADEAPLDVDLEVFAGTADTTVDRADAEAWARQTRRSFTLHEVDGGHFFHREPHFAGQLLARVR